MEDFREELQKYREAGNLLGVIQDLSNLSHNCFKSVGVNIWVMDHRSGQRWHIDPSFFGVFVDQDTVEVHEHENVAGIPNVEAFLLIHPVSLKIFPVEIYQYGYC